MKPRASSTTTLAAQVSGSAESETLVGGAPRRRGAISLGRGDLLGRYVVLDRLGAGGMGVVYAAYDPELDRKLAIKLLLPGHGDAEGDSIARTRLLREAQALAKLDHPHVVAIHDVGTVGDRVYLAMDIVEGDTLGAWRERTPRSWREVLDVIVAAGEGLAAAHDKGLVHRDIKPENIMVGADGRVRVMDFGLARTGEDTGVECPALDADIARAPSVLSSALTLEGSMMGTPAYMAPEQFSGAVIDPRTDQFSLCATAWEALYGQRPFSGESLADLAAKVVDGVRDPPPLGRRVPAWLRRVLERGLQSRAQDRFPDTRALLDALRADPTSRRRHIAWVAGIAGLAGLAYVAHEVVAQRAAEACVAEGATLREDWNDQARAEMEHALLATGKPFAATTFAKTVPWLDRWATSWSAVAEQACRAHTIEDSWDADLYARAQDCLQEARGNFVALVDAIDDADASTLTEATTAAAELAPVAGCSDPATLRERPMMEPEQREAVLGVRARLARASSSLEAGDHQRGLEQALDALDAAKASGWSPVVARAELQLGSVETERGDYASAEASLGRAFTLAREAHVPGVALDATVRLVGVVGFRSARYAEGLVWAEAAQLQLAWLASEHPLERAMLDNGLGLIRRAMGEYDEAERLHLRALELRERTLGRDHPQVGSSLNNLANVYKTKGNLDEAQRLYERARAIWEEALGPDHPQVAHCINNLALLHGQRAEYPEAIALYQRVFEIREQTLEPDHPDHAQGMSNLASVYAVLGDPDRAIPLYVRANAIWEQALGPEHPDLAIGLYNLAGMLMMTGAYEESRRIHERALAIRERAFGPDHIAVAASLGGLAAVREATKSYAEATRLQERALTIRERALGPDHPDVAVTLTDLCIARAGAGACEEAVQLCERALTIREGALGPDHPEVAQTVHSLARAFYYAGDYERAIELDTRALETWERALGPDHLLVGYALQGLGEAQLGAGRLAEAVALLERGLALRQTTRVPPDQLAETRYTLAKALWEVGGDRVRAWALAEEARDGYAAVMGQETLVAEVAEWLAAHESSRP